MRRSTIMMMTSQSEVLPDTYTPLVYIENTATDSSGVCKIPGFDVSPSDVVVRLTIKFLDSTGGYYFLGNNGNPWLRFSVDTISAGGMTITEALYEGDGFTTYEFSKINETTWPDCAIFGLINRNKGTLNGYCRARIAALSAYNSEGKLLDCIPCTDGVSYGLYDKINGNFMTKSAWTGSDTL